MPTQNIILPPTPNTNHPPQNPIAPVITNNSNKICLCVGINDYPGTVNDLNGCVNDANDHFAYLTQKHGFQGKLLLNSQVTWANVVNGIKDMISKSSAGWHIVFTYSGHGSSVPDQNGEEDDSKDECICLYDKWLIDDDIRSLMQTIPSGANFTFISDSCHSGSVTREFLSTTNHDASYSKPRFLPPPENVKKLIKRIPKTKDISQGDMKEILISGCKSTEYSYDAQINGRYNGAMTYYALSILKSNPNLSYNDFCAKLISLLPSKSYPQSPQLEGSEANKKRPMFT